MTQSYLSTKPSLISAIGIMTLVNGIINIMASLVITASIVFSTLGIGLLCAPISLLPAVLGVFEIIYGLQILANPPKPVKPSLVLAGLEIACIVFGNVVSLIVGILAIVFYNDEEVKTYFDNINYVVA